MSNFVYLQTLFFFLKPCSIESHIDGDSFHKGPIFFKWLCKKNDFGCAVVALMSSQTLILMIPRASIKFGTKLYTVWREVSFGKRRRLVKVWKNEEENNKNKLKYIKLINIYNLKQWEKRNTRFKSLAT